MKTGLFITFILSQGLIASEDHRTVVIVNANVEGRMYEGMGALSAGASSRLLIDYPEPTRSQILDYLFKPKFGASLNHFKVEIGGDVNSTCGTEPSHQHTRNDLNFDRGYEFWLMKEAKKRNERIVLDALPWGAPAWIGDGNLYSQDMADYVAGFVMGAEKHHGLDVDYVGIWNECPYDVEYIKLLRRTLDGLNLKTKIAAADEVRSYQIVKDMLRDPELYAAVDVVGTHYPLGQGEDLYNGKSVFDKYGKDYKIVWKEALDCGKPIWSLEDGPWKGDWSGAKGIAKILIRNYIEAKMVKTITWSLISSYHGNITAMNQSGLMLANTPWSGHYELQPALWAMAHVTQFAEPGWKYIEAGANGYLSQGGSYTSIMSPDQKDLSIIVETVDAKEGETLELNLIGGFSEKKFTVWRTDEVNHFVKLPLEIEPRNGKLSIHLDKGAIYSITTTTGQRKGDASLIIPEKKNFPLPYADDFESYEPDKLPRYTSDIAGCFEVAHQNGNKVLRQVSPSKGIEWLGSLNAEPFTIIGDMAMSDYSVAFDVKLASEKESASVMGRIPNIKQNQVIEPSGYVLKVGGDGKFRLLMTLPEIKNGKSEFRKTWAESNRFFTNHTKNSKIFTYDEIKNWPDERLDLFEGARKLFTEDEEKEDLLLILFSAGVYQIYKQKSLASGEVDFDLTNWNRLELSFSGETITGYVNGKKSCQVTDSTYKTGLAGIGAGWHTAIFDNLSIK